MPRWRQTKDPETGKYILVPIDDAARKLEGHYIRGDIEPFVSPIDGTVINSRGQLEDHCAKHNVVPAEEYSQAFFDRKAKEREAAMRGDLSRKEQYELRCSINEIINHHEARAK